ncbi:hypothetical protein Tco_1501679 [Tanacetum coccineum]
MNDSMSKLHETFQTWLQQRQEQVVNLDTYTPEPSQCRKIPICYDDDDDEESSIPLRDIIISELPPCIAITPESDGISESECDLPVCDDSSPKKDEVLDDIISIPPGNGNDHFNAESSLIESVLNRDNMISYPKIDFLLKEFTVTDFIAPIPPGIVEADFDPKGDIRFIENLMYDNSFPRPPETLKDDSETVIDSNNDYSSSDNSSLYNDDIDYVEASPPNSELVSLEVVEIVIPEVGGIDTDILLTIKDDILREKLLNVNLLIAKIEALKDIHSIFRFCDQISSGSPTSYLDLSLPDYEAFFCDMFDTLLPFSSENEDNVFNPGILASNEEKSPHLLSHRSIKAFQLISESPMMISGGDIPILDCSVFSFLSSLNLKYGDRAGQELGIAQILKTRARSFVLRSLDLHILGFILGIQYPNLID